MPKKKQVTFQSNIPGKFIPRDDTSSPSVFRSGTNANRFNSKMVELLASSSTSSSSSATVNNESEPILNPRRLSHDNTTISTSSETTSNDSSRVHSKLLHRRIVTMLETLRGRNGTDETTSPSTSTSIIHSKIGSKSQPITFGQLRQATTSSPSSTVAEENSSSKILSARTNNDLMSINSSDRQSYHTNLPITDSHSDVNLATSVTINRSSPKHQKNKERTYYSPFLEQHNVVPRIKDQDESKQGDEQQQIPKPPLTVDEILATYYSKVAIPITTTNTTNTTETRPLSQPSPYPNTNMVYYMHPSSLAWNSSQTTQHHIPPPPLLLNEQNRNRPPPPSYSLSVANGHRPPPMTNNLTQHLIRPPVPTSIREQVYSGPQIPQHLLPGNTPVIPSTSPAVRPPPPRYESPSSSSSSSSNIERSHSALSSMTRPNYSQINPPQAGFDREFSRLLYGKDGGKSRHRRQKRKAFSDPVKKSVEEAGRSVEKTHRRLTTHLNKTDTVTEEEETGSDSTDIDKYEQKYLHRKSNFYEINRESAKKPIVPANPLLKRRIPSFLRVYAQASSSSDILLQWHLFNQSELESYDGMMKKLYKDENLTRVQMYENYRTLLLSTLVSKKSKTSDDNDDDDDNGITTTAL